MCPFFSKFTDITRVHQKGTASHGGYSNTQAIMSPTTNQGHIQRPQHTLRLTHTEDSRQQERQDNS